jgi:hypothetical protein
VNPSVGAPWRGVHAAHGPASRPRIVDAPAEEALRASQRSCAASKPLARGVPVPGVLAGPSRNTTLRAEPPWMGSRRPGQDTRNGNCPRREMRARARFAASYSFG